MEQECNGRQCRYKKQSEILHGERADDRIVLCRSRRTQSSGDSSKVEKTVEAATFATDVAKVGTTASKVTDVVPEVVSSVTSAPRSGRLKLDLQHFASDAEGTGKAPNGNSKASAKPQHGYEISEKATGDVSKTGISGQPLNKKWNVSTSK